MRRLIVFGVIILCLSSVMVANEMIEKGKSYYFSGNFELAKISLEKALKSTTNDEILLMLGNSYLATGEPRKAINIFKEGIYLGSRGWIFEFNLAYAYYAVKDYTNSLSHFLSVKEKMPSFSKTYWFGGMSALRIADVSTTVFLWERYLEIAPGGEESENIRKALALLKEFGTNVIPEILKELAGESSDLELLIKGIENGFEIKSEQKTLEDTSLEDIEK
ncbi:MAG: hypothetical protein ABDH28_04105 [Brevinematia bacterium]